MARHHTVPEVYRKGFHDHAMVAKKQRKTVPPDAATAAGPAVVTLRGGGHFVVDPRRHQGRALRVDVDRARNVAQVFDSSSGTRVNTVDLLSADSADPTPGLAVIAPSGNRIFVSLRGPVPLSGDPHASTGSTPGLAVLTVQHNGLSGFVKLRA